MSRQARARGQATTTLRRHGLSWKEQGGLRARGRAMSDNEKVIALSMAAGLMMLIVIFAVCAYLRWY
jgi:hypothetical protein